MSQFPEKFENVGVVCKANVYFDGKVVSHTVLFKDGKKTLGLIYPGTYRFNTDAPEEMAIIAGACRYKLDGQQAWTQCSAGEAFNVAGKSAFDICVDSGVAQYICSFGA